MAHRKGEGGHELVACSRLKLSAQARGDDRDQKPPHEDLRPEKSPDGESPASWLHRRPEKPVTHGECRQDAGAKRHEDEAAEMGVEFLRE